MRDLFALCGEEIACVLVEPVAGNMGVVPPGRGFLETLRQVTAQAGSLLVFDEVITGFRVHYGGAQTLYGVKPDLTVLGKIIGGGFPMGAFGGHRDIMDMLAPAGPVYQAGTLSGNPVACAAGLTTLRPLSREDPYEELNQRTRQLSERLSKAAARAGAPVTINRVGSMLTVFFHSSPIVDYVTACECDTKRYAAFFHAMLQHGVYLPPSQFEAMFVSTAHREQDLEIISHAAESAFRTHPGG